jgi:heme-degrading monooxygenase HmoA
MIRFIEMDENVTLADQLQKGGKDDRRSVILRNKFDVKPDDVRGLLEAWAADAAYLKQKLGFISAQLHRSISGSCVFVNYAVWESMEYFN